MNKYIWKYKDLSEENVEQLASITGLDFPIVRMLIRRGLDSKAKVDRFLDSSSNKISNPFGLKDMEKGVARIEKAIKNNENIWIYGDYDVDGTTATSLFILALRKLGKDVDFYIPLREEGYGLNKEALLEIKEKGGELVITVDCGITSMEEVAYANEIGLDVVVTDHHSIGNKLPPAIAVINPRREENSYKFKFLAGVGTAFMVVSALYQVMGIEEKELDDFLDLVALGTIADMMPLMEENRIFVRNGLEAMKSSKNMGLKILIEKALSNTNIIDCVTVGFRIAPVFNAAGRMENASAIVHLLTSKSREECLELVSYLMDLNKKRQKIGKDIMESAELQIEEKNLINKGAIVVSSKEFHHGVIGIAASKLCKKYGKVAMVITIREDGTAVGSARSLEDTDLIVILEEAKDLLIKFGGHRQAAGFTLEEKNLEKFIEVIESIFTKKEKKYIPHIEIESEIHDFSISLEFQKKLASLAPFGSGNEEPILMIKGVHIGRKRLIGKDNKHLMFDIITRDRRLRNCPFFGGGDYFSLLDENLKFDLLFKLGENIYMGKKYLKIYIEDMRVSEGDSSSIDFYKTLFNSSFPILTEVEVPNLSLKVGDKIEIGKVLNGDFCPIIKGRDRIGFFKGDISALMRDLNSNYNFRFKGEVVETDAGEEHCYAKIRVDRCYDVRDSGNEKIVLNEIKNIVIGSEQYNAMQKDVLRNIIFDNKSLFLNSQEGRGIKSLALSIAIYHFVKSGNKSLFVGKVKRSEILNKYFDFSDLPKEGYPFTFYYNVPKKLVKGVDGEGKFLHFSSKKRDGEEVEFNNLNRVTIDDNFTLPNNVEIVTKVEEMVFNRMMSSKQKKECIDLLKGKNKLKALREIKAIL